LFHGRIEPWRNATLRRRACRLFLLVFSRMICNTLFSERFSCRDVALHQKSCRRKSLIVRVLLTTPFAIISNLAARPASTRPRISYRMKTKIKLLTQSQAAALGGWTTRRLRQIQDEDATVPRALDAAGRLFGYPPKELGDWLRSRCKRELRTVDGGEILDPIRERAMLDKERRRQLELSNQEKTGALIPMELVERLVGAAFTEIRAGLVSQQSVIASEHPEIPSDAIKGILAANRELLQRLASISTLMGSPNARFSPHSRD
jgi:phage terminase Nu1 subunit (DNA packaging protein)